MTRRVYKDPPIIEALCEVRFASDEGWNLTLPGRLHERLKETYDGIPQQLNAVEAQLGLQAGSGPSFNVRQSLGSVQLSTQDGRHLVRLGPDAISIHTLAPYEGWEAFRPRILSVVETYLEVAEPLGITRIGVRYINRIRVSSPRIDLADFFVTAQSLPTVEDLSMSGFLHRSELLFEGGPIKALTTMASVDDEPEVSAFVIDIDVLREWMADDVLDAGEVSKHIDDLHDREGQVFEGMITDRARELFG